MFSKRSRPIYSAAGVCAGIALSVSACSNRVQDRSDSTLRPAERSSSRSDIYQPDHPQAWRIKPPEVVPIDPDWPRRVANVVGFAPPDLAADYTAHVMSKPTSRAVGETLFVVRRRKHWVRIDEHFQGRVGTRFINLSTEIVVSADGEKQARYIAIQPLTNEPWNGQGRLISLRTEALQDVDVAPPTNLFALETWTALIPSAPATPSYSVILQGNDDSSEPVILTERRRGSLTYREAVSDRQRDLSLVDDRGGFQFLATYTLDGRLVRLSVNTNVHPRVAPLPDDSQVAETVIGETCRWEDSAEGVYDITRTRCLARDGATLIDVAGARGLSRRVTAVSISRKPISLRAVLPPQAAFSSLKP